MDWLDSLVNKSSEYYWTQKKLGLMKELHKFSPQMQHKILMEQRRRELLDLEQNHADTATGGYGTGDANQNAVGSFTINANGQVISLTPAQVVTNLTIANTVTSFTVQFGPSYSTQFRYVSSATFSNNYLSAFNFVGTGINFNPIYVTQTATVSTTVPTLHTIFFAGTGSALITITTVNVAPPAPTPTPAPPFPATGLTYNSQGIEYGGEQLTYGA
jgi:hypothetical protein